jgi:hypothetical protein
MNWRRLIFLASLLVLVIGLLLAAFSTDGWFNPRPNAQFFYDTPFGRFHSDSPTGPPGPVIGYFMMIGAAVGFVVTASMKPRA